MNETDPESKNYDNIWKMNLYYRNLDGTFKEKEEWKEWKDVSYKNQKATLPGLGLIDMMIHNREPATMDGISLKQEDIKDNMAELLSKLSIKERRILELLDRGYTQQEIALKLKMTQQNVSSIHLKLRRMYLEIENRNKLRER